ncbi:MAG: DJ-1/PfpI family protein [Oscillospiraceae bacterium]|jgi:4-methyl-5(b-hydroxyethyl)-thiazole monophosphate biosynthesis|nr:DJ-1/PfpI family protein [Oscillospiraceae bacterium]
MVYVFLADGFEETEAVVPIDVWRRCGISVTTVGVTGEYVTGSHNITVKADITAQQSDFSDAEAIFLPGGARGVENLGGSETVRNAVKRCADASAYITAICAAPSILGEMGLLEGKKATCYPGFEGKLKGAFPSAQPVVVDGKFITGRAAGAAERFAFTVAETLAGGEKAARVFTAMLCEGGA